MLVPVLYAPDIAGPEAARVAARHEAVFGGPPGWQALLAHDAARLILAGIEAAPEGAGARALRSAIRADLASALPGLMAPPHFDGDADGRRPFIVASVAEDGGLEIASLHLHLVDHPARAEGQEFARTADGARLLAIEVLRVCVELERISPVDDATRSFGAALDLWLVGRKGFDPADLVFEGAAEPLRLGEPVAPREGDGLSRQRFRVEGTFRYGAPKEDLLVGQRRLRVAPTTRCAPARARCCCPTRRAWNAGELGDRLRGDAGSRVPVLLGMGWRIADGRMGERVAVEPTLRDPALPGLSLAVSQLGLGIDLHEAGLAPGPILRGLVPAGLGLPLALVALAGAALAWRRLDEPGALGARLLAVLSAAVILARVERGFSDALAAGSARGRWRWCSRPSAPPGGRCSRRG